MIQPPPDHRPARLVRALGILLLLTLFSPPARAAGPVLYVRAAASGSGDGSSWANAYPQLSSALTAAASGQAIWVAAGTYRPTTGSDRAASFVLKNGVAIYGGFNGTETLLGQRNWTANLVILSGDLLGNDVGFTNNAENSYHVVTGATGASLDGVTIRGGNGYDFFNKGGGLYNNQSSPALTNVTISGNTGGGIYNTNSSPVLNAVTLSGNIGGLGAGLSNENGSSPTLTNVTISNNIASMGGGAIWNAGPSSPILNTVTISGNKAADGGGIYNNVGSGSTLTNVTFTGNIATSNGGGMYIYAGGSAVLTNVTFSANTAGGGGGGGGGMYNEGSAALTNVTFSGNSANFKGGGMYTDKGNNVALTNVTISGNSAADNGGGLIILNSSPVLTNVTISGNTANNGGGVYTLGAGKPQLTNLTISGNSAAHNGGGLLSLSSAPVLTNVTISGNSAPDSGGGLSIWNSNPLMRNSIVWGNSSGIFHSNSPITISTSLIQGSGGSAAWNPAAGVDGGGNRDADPRFISAVPAAPTTAGNLRLRPGSPALDAGSNGVANPSLPATDRDGNPRIVNATVDMGAYEQHFQRVFLPLLRRP